MKRAKAFVESRLVLLIIAGSILVLTSEGCARPFLDTIKETSLAAVRIASHQPPPVQQQRIESREVDILEMLSKGQVLIGTWYSRSEAKFAGFDRDFGPDKLMVVNYLAGDTLWLLSRRELGANQEVVGVSKSAIVLRTNEKDTTSLYAINSTNGRLIWSWKGNAGTSLSIIEPKNIVVVAEPRGSTVHLSAIELTDSAYVWEANVDNILDSKGIGLEVIADSAGVIISGMRIVRIDVLDGRILWTMTSQAGGFITTMGQEFALATGDTLCLVSSLNGSRMWTQRLAGGKIELLTVSGKRLHALLRGIRGEDPQVIVTLDSASGRELWRIHEAEQIRSPIVCYNGLLFYTTANRLVALNAIDGHPEYSTKIPTELPPSVLLDLLSVVGHRIIVARESGAVGIDLSDGKVGFFHTVPGGRRYTSEYLDSKMDGMIAGAIGKRDTLLTSSRSVNWMRGAEAMSDALYRQARADQANVYRQTQSTLHSPYSTSTQRMIALDKREISIMSSQSAARLQAGMALASAIEDAAKAIRDVILSGWARSVSKEQMQLGELQRRQARENHLRSLQGGYYIRPCYSNGAGLTLVDLTSGRRVELVVSPPNVGLETPGAINLPKYLVDEESGLLVTKGLGTDTSKFVCYSYDDFMRIDCDFAEVLFERYSVPYYSLLVYKIDSLKFGPGIASAAPMISDSMRRQDVRLFEAVLGGEKDTVRSALEAGANINARDYFGRTALMLAAQMKFVKIVELLCEQGADITLRDPEGFTAFEYIWLPKSVNLVAERKIVEALKDAAEKKSKRQD